MKKLNRKGFTLVELLAVIVILGILMLTAIPAVTRAIAKSRRNTYWQNAKQYIQAVQTPLISGEYKQATKDGANFTKSSTDCGLPAQGKVVAVPISAVELEGGTKERSSFGVDYYNQNEKCRPYVYVKNTGNGDVDKYEWYFSGTDKSGNGIISAISETDLGIGNVTTGNSSTSCNGLDSADMSANSITNYTFCIPA